MKKLALAWLGFGVLVALAITKPHFLRGSTTYYASPVAQGGAGTTCSIGSPCTVSYCINTKMVAGDVCRLKGTDPATDGHYTGTADMISPSPCRAGSPGNLFTVVADTDGKAYLDGQSARQPVNLNNGCNYWDIEGIWAAHSNGGGGAVLDIAGSNNIVRRSMFWDAPNNYNIHVTSIHGNSAGDAVNGYNNLLEDVGAFGLGRKQYESFQSNGNTFRRIWGMWENSIVEGPKRTLQPNYYSYNTIVDNAIFQSHENLPAGTYLVLDYSGTGAGAVLSIDFPGVWSIIRTSATSMTVATGAGKVFTVSGGSGTVFTVGSQIRAYRQATENTYMDGTVSASSASTVTVNCTSVGGSGTFTDWNLTDKTVNVTTPKMQAAQGLMAELEWTSGKDIHPDGNDQLNGILIMHVQADNVAYQGSASSLYAPFTLRTFGGQHGKDWFVYAPSVTEVNAGANVRGYSLQATSTGHTQSFLDSVTTVIPGTNVNSCCWTVTNDISATSLATALVSGSLYDGASGRGDGKTGAKMRYQYINGVLTSTPLWPWPAGSLILAATTFASTDGHNHPIVDINGNGVNTGLVPSVFGAFPGAATATPTPTNTAGGPTSTNTPTQTQTPTPFISPTPTPTASSNCNNQHIHFMGSTKIIHTHGGPCVNGKIAPHTHPVPTPNSN